MHIVHIRAAGRLDAPQMADLLNAIIAKGGTTAITKPVTRADILSHMHYRSEKNAWSLAEDDKGNVLGFQYIEPKDTLPENAADIATFVKIGKTGLGVGSKLFERTVKEAKRLGFRWINATIRCDNTGGLAYYQSRGFEVYTTETGKRLDDGTLVNRVSKRFNV